MIIKAIMTVIRRSGTLKNSKTQILSISVIKSLEFPISFRLLIPNIIVKLMEFIKLTPLFLLLNLIKCYHLDNHCLIHSTIINKSLLD